MLDLLGKAADAPKDKDRNVKRNALPQFFTTWATSAQRAGELKA